MAIFRAELKSGTEHNGIYDAICETTADVGPDTWEAGSMIFCIADGNVYVKTPNGQWTAAGEAAT